MIPGQCVPLMEAVCCVRELVRTGHVSSSIVLTTSGSGVRLRAPPPASPLPPPFSLPLSLLLF